MNAPARPLGFVAASPCGGIAAAIGGDPALLRQSGALWLEAERALVVADLHFEKGSAYARRGQMLPPYDTRETLRRLALEVEALSPRLVVLLGDTLHDGGAEARIDAEDAAAIDRLAAGRTLLWIVGNHDADGPRQLAGEVGDEIALSGLLLRHEPQAGLQPGEVAGHLHPCARVRGRGASVRRRCFVTDGERLILPAVGAYAGGLNVRDAAFSGLFARPPTAVALGPRKAHAVAWGALGAD